MSSTAPQPLAESNTMMAAKEPFHSAQTTDRKPPKGKPPNRNSKKQPPPTHFLALPLVTTESLPQLARSIERFQSVTTSPRTLRPSEIQASERERAQETPERDVIDAEGRSGIHGKEVEDTTGEAEEALKIIPAQAHRPPGTLHLTLGTMFLATRDDMRRALDVLRSVDFAAMLLGAAGPAEHVASTEGNSSSRGTETQDSLQAEPETNMDAGKDVAAALTTLSRPISPPPPSGLSTTTTVPAKATATTTTSNSRGRTPPPLRLDLKGLSTFPSARKSRVFYAAPCDPSRRLQKFAEAVQQRFIEEGIVRKEGRALTLHATVANLKYVKTPKWHHRGKKTGAAAGEGKNGGKDRAGREVDARGVIEAFGRRGGLVDDGNGGEGEEGEAFIWAEGIVVDRIRICKMGAVKSEDEVMGMEYPAIKVPVEGDGDGNSEGEIAEVVFV